MKTSVLICAILTISIAHQARADVALITLNELESKLAHGGDTTFVVNFWATWCKPCVAELPYFEQLHNDTTLRNIKVVLVSVDSPKDIDKVVRPFLERKKLLATAFVLNEKKPHEWIDRIDASWSGAVPATLLVQHESRKFFEREFSYASLLQAVKQFLADNSSSNRK